MQIVLKLLKLRTSLKFYQKVGPLCSICHRFPGIPVDASFWGVRGEWKMVKIQIWTPHSFLTSEVHHRQRQYDGRLRNFRLNSRECRLISKKLFIRRLLAGQTDSLVADSLLITISMRFQCFPLKVSPKDHQNDTERQIRSDEINGRPNLTALHRVNQVTNTRDAQASLGHCDRCICCDDCPSTSVICDAQQ